MGRGLDNRWTDDRRRHAVSAPRDQRFGEALREGVDVGPPELTCTLHPNFDQFIPHPALLLLAELRAKLRRRDIPAALDQLLVEHLGDLRTL